MLFYMKQCFQTKFTYNVSYKRAITISEVGEEEKTNPDGSHTTNFLVCMDLNPPLLRMKPGDPEHP